MIQVTEGDPAKMRTAANSIRRMMGVSWVPRVKTQTSLGCNRQGFPLPSSGGLSLWMYQWCRARRKAAMRLAIPRYTNMTWASDSATGGFNTLLMVKMFIKAFLGVFSR